MKIDTPLAANIINLVVGVSTFAAVVVVVAINAICMNRKQSREDCFYAQQLAKEDRLHIQQLAREERQHQNRPIIVPVGELSHHTSDGLVDWNAQRDTIPPSLDRTAQLQARRNRTAPVTIPRTSAPNIQELTLQNMGNNVAFNAHSFLYGPMDGPGNQYTSWNNGPIQDKTPVSVLYTHGATFLFPDTKVSTLRLKPRAWSCV
ncbi:hypothetical protein [Ktedonobacter sp. SOSP1-85]|uniref:hypothetical protein n=1 Tax=Ktedonobacter sp. SOSP1-85 TaxID=2778367 RepID=UPI0019157596|nr:hypothetical protein [Ktedonobacter sp. SOSP1-85]